MVFPWRKKRVTVLFLFTFRWIWRHMKKVYRLNTNPKPSGVSKMGIWTRDEYNSEKLQRWENETKPWDIQLVIEWGWVENDQWNPTKQRLPGRRVHHRRWSFQHGWWTLGRGNLIWIISPINLAWKVAFMSLLNNCVSVELCLSTTFNKWLLGSKIQLCYPLQNISDFNGFQFVK